MFSFFDIESIDNVIEIERHNLETLKKKTIQPVQRKTLFILGSTEFSDFYIKKLLDIKEKFEPNNIIYFPHRKEEKQNIYKIKNLLKCKIDFCPRPVESKLKNYDFQPEYIVGFFTTALASIAIICPKSKLYNSLPDPHYESKLSDVFKNFFLNFNQC
jgi:hypothetical protein